MTEAGVDLVEVQMPFTEPIADGETFALASQIAVAEGMTNASYFSLLANVRETTTIPVVAMGYYNWPHSMGLDSFASTLSALARIHRRTPMDGVRKAEGGVRELQGK